MRGLAKTALKHAIVFSVLVLGMFITLFIMGQFTVLHEDAYIDGLMSIVYVYAVIIVFLIAFYLVQRFTNLSFTALPRKLVQWNRESGVFIHIAMLFTGVTVVNSVMMLVGIDTPKTGTFAYSHLLVRMLIVSIAGMAWMIKTVFEHAKQFVKQKNLQGIFDVQAVIDTIMTRPLSASAAVFTVTVVIGCAVIIIFQRWIDVQGGSRLYAALLIWYGLWVIVSIGIKVYGIRNKPAEETV